MRENVAENTERKKIRYRLRVPVKGVFYDPGRPDWKIPLTEDQLTYFEQPIQYSLHNTEDIRPAPDHGRLFGQLPRAELKEKIDTEEISVLWEDGILYGCIEIRTNGFLTEEEGQTFSDYVKEQFREGWGKRFYDRVLLVDRGILRFWFEPPGDYHFQEQKKYEITGIVHPKYPWLRRIRALITVREDVGSEVRAGDLGGYVEHEGNLSQEGSCWISDDAICCEDAVVEADVQMSGQAVAKDYAVITRDACLSGCAWAEERCRIHGGNIREQAVISGEALITGRGMCTPDIGGHSRIYGRVHGRYKVRDTVFPGEVYQNTTRDLILLQDGKQTVVDIEQRTLQTPKDFQKRGKKRSCIER